MTDNALLALEDGSLFYGVSFGIDGEATGEVVFNTAMTGYQEILTDPSYYQQVVTLTHPHIGNVGANSEDEESEHVYVSGLVIRDLPIAISNWRATDNLSDYLKKHKNDENIFTRDIAWLKSANVVVAEVTTPSLGVGYELGIAEKTNIPVLCLYRKIEGKSLSAMILGNKRFNCACYTTLEEVKSHINKFLKEYKE